MFRKYLVFVLTTVSLALTQPAVLGQEVRSIEPVGRHRLEAGGVARVVRSGNLRGIPQGTAVSAETTPPMDPPLAVSWDAEGQNIVLGVPSITEPGDYEIVLSWLDERGRKSGEKFTLTVGEMPRLAEGNQEPVVLLNGLQVNDLISSRPFDRCPVSSGASDTFGKLQSFLVEKGSRVVFFDNCKECWNCSIERLSSVLGAFLAKQRSPDGTIYTGQFDLIGHSMGGLVARSYLSGKQEAPGRFTPPPTPRVRKLVTVGTPHAGAAIAPNIGVQASQLTMGSRFLWDLATWNQVYDDLRGVDALAIAGSACNGDGLGDSGDGAVSLSSASLGFSPAFETARTRVVPYAHSDQVKWVNWECFGARNIAEVDGPDHDTWRIIESFLSDSEEWRTIGQSPSQDVHLASKGGMTTTLLDNLGNSISTRSATLDGRDPIYSGTSLVPKTYYHQWVPAGTHALQFETLANPVSANIVVRPGGHQFVPLKFGPQIILVAPKSGFSNAELSVKAGENILIYGLMLAVAESKTIVTVNGSPLVVTTANEQQVEAVLPPMASGIATLTLENSAGQHTINIMVHQASPPILEAAPSELDFQSLVSTTSPPVRILQVLNLGGGTLNWTATSSAPWLRITPLSGTAPSSLSVSANPSGLPAGAYSASIHISSPGLPDCTVPVTFSILQVAVPLTVDSNSVTLTTSPADGSGLSQVLHVSSGSTLNFTVSISTEFGGNWLSANPVSGRTPATVTISADASNLEPGEYSGKLVVVSDGASNGPQVVDVKLNVGKSVAIHSIINEASLMPVLASGGRTVINGRFPVTAFPEGEDVCAADATGVLPTVLCGVKVTINGAELPLFSVRATSIHLLMPREYGPGSLQVTVDDIVSVEKSVEILPAAPGLYRLETGLLAAKGSDGVVHDIAAPILTDTEENRTIMFLATGAGVSGDLTVPMGTPVPDDIVYMVSWPEVLKIDDVQLEEGSILTAVHPANSLGVWQYTIKLPPLSAGRHKFEFCIWGQCDQTEIVTLEKMQHLPLVNPGSLFFSIVEGGAMPPAQEVKVGFTYGGTVPWSATSDSDWLSVAPNTGEGEGQMSVSLVAVALPPPGTYTGKIAIKADEASSEPLIVNCLLSIKRASSAPYGAFDTPTGTSSGPGGDIAVVVVSPRNPRLRKTDQGLDPAAGEEARRSHGLIDEFPFPPARPPERAKPAEVMFFPPARPSIRGKPAE